MSACPGCKTENPQASKFCAGCGAALPKEPVNVRCAGCGAESPEGSRFCKGCGKPIAASAGPPGPSRSWPGSAPGGPSGAVRPKAAGEAVQRIKMLLGVGAGLYAFGIFMMYSDLSRVRAAFGAYAGQVPGTGLQWLLIILDAALAAGNIYAITLVGKGEFKYAKWLFGAMAGLGIIFLLRGFSGPVVYILINAGLIASGVYGWRLASREEKGLAA